MRTAIHTDSTHEIVQRLCAAHQRQMNHLKTSLQKELANRHAKEGVDLTTRDSVDVATGTTSTEFHGFPSLTDDEKSALRSFATSAHISLCHREAYPCVVIFTSTTHGMTTLPVLKITKKLRMPLMAGDMTRIALIIFAIAALCVLLVYLFKWLHGLVHNVDYPWLPFKL